MAQCRQRCIRAWLESSCSSGRVPSTDGRKQSCRGRQQFAYALIIIPMTFLSRVVLPLLALFVCSCSRRSNQAPDPLSPDESLHTFRLSEDFHMELFATEPNV